MYKFNLCVAISKVHVLTYQKQDSECAGLKHDSELMRILFLRVKYKAFRKELGRSSTYIISGGGLSPCLHLHQCQTFDILTD
jgi:hypothetical protein